jgi:hypothetical protein
MSPIVDQESTFDDTGKSGNAHICAWRQLIFINFLRFRFTEFHTFFAADWRHHPGDKGLLAHTALATGIR